jgi:hypothetical protein
MMSAGMAVSMAVILGMTMFVGGPLMDANRR